jgi:hypothetical protein
MSTLTSSIYSMGPSRKTLASKKKDALDKKKKDINHTRKMKQLNALVESQRKLRKTLDSLRDLGLLEVRVIDAVRPEWTLVPKEWTDYDFSVEEYRVTGCLQSLDF